MNVSNTLRLAMIGPSSSHTVGATRIGRITLVLLGTPAIKVDISLHGSFTGTYKGHGTDEILIVGIMRMTAGDSRVRRTPELAREQGLEVNIVIGGIDGAHPNTTRVAPTDAAGSTVSLLGSSIDGGNVLVKKVDGMEVSIVGQHTTPIVFHRDAPGTIAVVTEVMADAGVSVCNFRLSRQSRGGEVVMTTEIDGSSGPKLNEKVKVLPNIFSNTTFQPIQLMKPITTGGFIFMGSEFSYSSVTSIVTTAEKNGLLISVIVLRQQAEQMEQTEESIYEHIWKNYRVMTKCIEPGCNKDLRSTGGLTSDSALKMRQIPEGGKSLTDSPLSGALYRALAVSELNATMGRIMTVPTARSCGILPAALPTMQGERRILEGDYAMSLFAAPAVGMVIANSTSLAGAQSECQTECGSTTAVVAITIVELTGGTPKMAEHAITTTIKNILGLVCDPVAEPVEIPCIERNTSGMAGVFAAVELALTGIESAIPVGEVIWTMKKAGDVTSSTLKETAEDGLTVTPMGRHFYEHVFGIAREAHSGCSGYGGCSS